MARTGQQAVERFPFRFDARFRAPLSVLGIRPATCQVAVGEQLEIHYGPWHVATPWSNVTEAATAAPFSAFKAIGPRLSMADRGATFGTSTRGGVCFRFEQPVGGLLGDRLVRHPGITVTVADPDGLVSAVQDRRVGSS